MQLTFLLQSPSGARLPLSEPSANVEVP